MPSVDIDGRGDTPEEAVKNMWERIIPLKNSGYHPVSSVELVDIKTNKTVDTFQLDDPQWAYVNTNAGESKRPTPPEHRPPKPDDFRYKARVKLEQ